MRIRGVLVAIALGVAALAQGLPPSRPNVAPPVQLPLPAPGAADLAGGVPPAPGTATQPLALSLKDAIQRGLRYNLGPLLAASAGDQARAQRMAEVAALLPNVTASAGELRQKINLAAFGFSFPGFPALVGPFNVFQASAAADIPVVNISALQRARAARGLEAAAKDDYNSARNLVVLAVANQYLLSVADQSRVEAAQAELATADSALTQAQDMLNAGTVGALAAVRAQVQRDRQRQQLTAQQNALAKQRLQLARAVGLPGGQAFTLTSATPFAALEPPSADAAVAQALATRPDYKAAKSLIHSSELLVAAAKDRHLPTVSLDGNYGTIGHEIGSNHPIYSVGANLQMPIFSGGSIAAERLAAESQLHQAQSRAADLRAAIDVQVRSAILDLQSNRDQVGVARDARDLADRELTLAQDRFKAGVADNLEVVQAQQSVADADENYIASLYGYNLAKASLAQALGIAATNYSQYLPQ